MTLLHSSLLSFIAPLWGAGIVWAAQDLKSGEAFEWTLSWFILSTLALVALVFWPEPAVAESVALGLVVYAGLLVADLSYNK